MLVTILRSSVQLSPLGGATPAGRRRIDRKYYRSALSSVADVIDSQRVARSALPSPAPLRARCFGRPSVRPSGDANRILHHRHRHGCSSCSSSKGAASFGYRHWTGDGLGAQSVTSFRAYFWILKLSCGVLWRTDGEPRSGFCTTRGHNLCEI